MLKYPLIEVEFVSIQDDVKICLLQQVIGVINVINKGVAVSHLCQPFCQSSAHTGLIVNDKVNVTRRSRRRMRAAVHARTVGRTPTWHGKPVSDAQLRGRLAFLKMVQPDESQRLLAMLENAIEEQEL